MRVIAGKAKGRPLRAPEGRDVRPTGDKVKGAVFNVLATYGEPESFLDLFAGSGAMGIEAWSRGAESVTFVENDRRARLAIERNLNTVGFTNSRVLFSDWRPALLSLIGSGFDVIYADPPYDFGYYSDLLHTVRRLGILSANGILCLEYARKRVLPPFPGWSLDKCRNYGEVAVAYFRQEQD